MVYSGIEKRKSDDIKKQVLQAEEKIKRRNGGGDVNR